MVNSSNWWMISGSWTMSGVLRVWAGLWWESTPTIRMSRNQWDVNNNMRRTNKKTFCNGKKENGVALNPLVDHNFPYSLVAIWEVYSISNPSFVQTHISSVQVWESPKIGRWNPIKTQYLIAKIAKYSHDIPPLPWSLVGGGGAKIVVVVSPSKVIKTMPCLPRPRRFSSHSPGAAWAPSSHSVNGHRRAPPTCPVSSFSTAWEALKSIEKNWALP